MKDIAYKFRLLRGLINGDRAWAGPGYVNIDVTHRCNLRCRLCRWHSPLLEKTLLDPMADRDFPADLFEQLCQSLAAMGTRTMLFVGAGEPLLHPQILDLIAAAKHRRFELIMYSNGTLLQEDRCEDLAASGLDVLRVSFLPELSEAFEESCGEGVEKAPPDSGQPRSEQVLDGLRRLARVKARRGTRRPVVELTHPIRRHDFGRLDEAIRLVQAGLVERLGFSVVLDFGQAAFREECLSDEEARQFDAELAAFSRRLDGAGIPHNIPAVRFRLRQGARGWEKMPCYAPWYFAFLNTNGQVMACQRATRPMGDLRQQTFAEIWNGPAYREFRRLALAPGGLASIQDHCHCDYCPHAVNHARVHRFARWLRPLWRPTGNGDGKP